jgi:hypothetical protein
LCEDQGGHGKEERGRERGKFTDELHTEIILMLLIARILATFINQRINDPRDRKDGAMTRQGRRAGPININKYRIRGIWVLSRMCFAVPNHKMCSSLDKEKPKCPTKK